ncbi:hypothetical protein ACFLZ1_05055 [Patescibacteria group bacterium]
MFKLYFLKENYKVLKLFLLAFLVSVLVFVSHFLVVGKAVYGDGHYYYSYARSVIIDQDLDFENELEYFGRNIVKTTTGKTVNIYSPGAPLLWTPFFIAAHIFSSVLNYFQPVSTDGYGIIYQLFIGIGCIIYSFLGLFLCYLTNRCFFSEKISLLAVFFIWLASNLFFYTTLDPLNSHSASFFMSSIFLYLLFGKGKKTNATYFLLGIIVALLGLIRIQNLIFVVPVLLGKVRNLKVWFKTKIYFALALVIGFLPQLWLWNFLYGEYKSPYLAIGHSFNWLKPNIFLVLFSNNNGLFYFSPVLFFTIIGLLLLYKKQAYIVVSGILLFLIQLYIISSWSVWWGGASYGNRMFISLMPFFMLGMANLLSILKKVNYKYIVFIGVVFVALNFYSIYKFLLIN